MSDTPNNVRGLEDGPYLDDPMLNDTAKGIIAGMRGRIKQLERELAEAKADIERMKIDAGKAYCVYCGTSGPKADIWKHVTVCDKHPLKTMADKMEEASGMIQVAMLIFDELGLSGDATAVTAVESIQKLKAELAEYRAATDPHYVDELAALKAENARLAKALEEVLPRLLELKLFQSAHICQQALASRGRENKQANPKLNQADGPTRDDRTG